MMKLHSLFLAMLVIGSVTVSPIAAAQDGFWKSPNTERQSFSHQNSVNFPLAARLDSSDQLDVGGRAIRHQSVALSQSLTDRSSIELRYESAGEQRNYVLGFQQNNISVSMLRGQGENYSQLGGSYSGVDPYLFHGGWKQDFSISGFALDYNFARFGHVQFGEAKVSADGLEDRRGRYLEWSNQRYFARASRFDRGSEFVGHGFDFGVAFNGTRVAFQTMDLDGDKRMQRLRFEFSGKQSRRYWLDLSAHQNPLFEANNDYRIMFNFKTLLGARKLASYQNETVSDDEGASEETDANKGKNKKGGGWKRAVLIGGGIAAAAALSSSGSAMADGLVRFRTQNEAARDVLNEINPSSVRINREFGGWIYNNPDGSFASTEPVRGEVSSVTLPDPSVAIPRGSRLTASYHTHGGFDPRFDNENFSEQDLENDRALGIDGYLATPLGQFKLHDIETDTIIVLGSVATL